MRVQCQHCDKRYTLPDERVAGRILKIKCRQCEQLFEVDGSSVELTEKRGDPANEGSLQPESASHHKPESRLEPSESEPRSEPALEPTPKVQLESESSSVDDTTSTTESPTSTAIAEELSVEMSSADQEWMNELITDAARPLTRELKIQEVQRALAEHEATTGSSRRWIWMLAICLLIGGGAALSSPQMTHLLSGDQGEVMGRDDEALSGSSAQNQPIKVASTSLSQLNTEGREPSAHTLTQEERLNKVGDQGEGSKNQANQTQPQPKKRDQARAKSPVKSRKGRKSTSLKKTPNSTLDALKSLAKQEEQSDSKELTASLEASAEATRSYQASKRAKRSSKPKTSTPKRRTSRVTSKKKNAKSPSSSTPQKRSASTKKTRVAKRKPRSRRIKKRGPQGLTNQQISQVIQQNSGGLRSCYRKLLKKKPTMVVNTRLSFEIQPAGKASRPTIHLERPHRGTRFEKCIQNMVARWYFPRTDSSSRVKRYPLKFSPGF